MQSSTPQDNDENHQGGPPKGIVDALGIQLRGNFVLVFLSIAKGVKMRRIVSTSNRGPESGMMRSLSGIFAARI